MSVVDVMVGEWILCPITPPVTAMDLASAGISSARFHPANTGKLTTGIRIPASLMRFSADGDPSIQRSDPLPWRYSSVQWWWKPTGGRTVIRCGSLYSLRERLLSALSPITPNTVVRAAPWMPRRSLLIASTQKPRTDHDWPAKNWPASPAALSDKEHPQNPSGARGLSLALHVQPGGKTTVQKPGALSKTH